MSDLNDDELLEQIGAAFAKHDPVPESALSFAKGVHRLLGLEAELASVESDSLVGAEGMRSTDTRRTIVFSTGDVTIRIEVTDQVEGTVNPSNGTLDVQLDDGTSTTVEVSDSGFFMFENPRTSFRLILTTPQGSIATEWVRCGD